MKSLDQSRDPLPAEASALPSRPAPGVRPARAGRPVRPQPERRATWWVAAAVFALALAVRLAYAFEIRDLPTLHELVMDAQRYDQLARDILDHGWRPREAFYQAPLYPYLLAAVYALSGRSLTAMRLAQALVGALTAALTGAIALVYLLVYTPLKPVTPLSMIAGAISGALPPVAGWAASKGQLGPGPWVLAGIMFFWQITHTLAIGHLYRQDYARAGMRPLPVLDEGGGSTSLQAFNNCLALLPVGMLPTLIGLTGGVYLVLSTVLALGFLWTAARFVQDRSAPAARRLLMASLVYLPALLAVMAFDRQGH